MPRTSERFHRSELFFDRGPLAAGTRLADPLSTIRADTEAQVGRTFEALFPCGSVTGAPKIRAMQVIHDIEAGPRGAHCGSIGWIAPSGAMEFNVAIRTLMCRPDSAVRLNVGGGVVYDSTAAAEYREALLKSRFADLS